MLLKPFHSGNTPFHQGFEYIFNSTEDVLIQSPTDIKNISAENFVYTFINKTTNESVTLRVKEDIFPERFFELRTKKKLGTATPEEKKALLRLLGAELLEVEDELCPLFPTEGARGVVKSMVESEALNGRYVSPNQYESEFNVEAHYHTTGPEIWEQTGGAFDAFVAGAGTGGAGSGGGRW